MIEVRRFDSLGRFDNDWLSARYHFSFAAYRDPARAGVGPLLVWNDDTIQPGRGFDRHGHQDMEIVTYVRAGAITHEDHLGNRGRTEAGDVQVMSAGTGISHAEHNLESTETRIFQIWIEPARAGLPPRWEQRRFPTADRHGGLIQLASGRAGDDGALKIHQDAAILGAALPAGRRVTHRFGRGRRGYLVAAHGEIELGGHTVLARDGVLIANEETIAITARTDAEILLADLP
ncbi:MAG: pirin family protein [Kiloniellaceae bacterium]